MDWRLLPQCVFFVDRVKDLHVAEDEMMVSFDVVALYPSIPQDEAISLIRHHLEHDLDLRDKTKMTPDEIIELFEICVNDTYFVFNMKLYAQVEGLAIGASTSGFAADIFMERIEKNALSSIAHPPKIWCRFVDDTFTIILIIIYIALFDALNSQHHRIKVTSEIQSDDKLSFLEVLTRIQIDRSLKFTIFRKKTHTDQYLHFNSNHHMSQKLGIPKTLNRRADMLVTDKSEQEKEKYYAERALRRCGYPTWATDKAKKKKTEKINPQKEDDSSDGPLGYVPIPYVKHLSEKLGRLFKKHDITTIYKASRTIKSIVCNKIKDKVPDMDKTGVIYHIDCKRHIRTDYTGETDAATKTRGYQHHLYPRNVATTSEAIKKEMVHEPDNTQTRYSLRNKDPVDYKKLNDGTATRHFFTQGNTAFSPHMLEDHAEGDVTISVLGQEKNRWRRGVKEALHINRIQPTENKKIVDGEGDRFKLANIYQADEFRNKLFSNYRPLK